MNVKLVIYSLLLAALAIILKIVEYRLVVIDHAVELYEGFIALVFISVGIWAGIKLARNNNKTIEKHEFNSINPETPVIVDSFGLSKREHEILGLMAQGLSNQEISERIFLSIHTVKSHISNLFTKLEVKSRTQAIKKAKDFRLII